MLEQIKKILAPILEFWGKLSKKFKIVLTAVAAFVLIFAVAMTFLLNRSAMATLYTGLSPEETTAILSQLQEMSIAAKVEGTGTILIDSKIIDLTKAQLATMGYPKSGLAYTYLDDVSLLSTDSDRKRAAQKETQERLAGTISLYEGVKSAVVNLSMPERASTVLNMYDEPAKAAVTVTTHPGASLSSEVVKGIATLVAASVPRLSAENVTVSDQRGLWLNQDSITGGYNNQADIQKYQLETMMETKIRDDVERVGVPFYGPDGIMVTVRVQLTQDDKKTQTGTYLPNNADGTGGLITEETESTIREGVGGVNGIPGENNNAEIPTYPEGFLNGTYFLQSENNRKYAIDFVEEQLQTVGYRVDKMNIAVVVDDEEMTEGDKEELTAFFASAIGASAADVSVIGRSLYIAPPTEPDPIYMTSAFYWLLGAGVIALLVFAYLVILLSRAIRGGVEKSRQRKEEERQREEDAARKAADEMAKRSEEAELARMKEELDKISLNSEVETKEQKIKEEIREFAKENPEIVAQIVKTLLKNEYD